MSLWERGCCCPLLAEVLFHPRWFLSFVLSACASQGSFISQRGRGWELAEALLPDDHPELLLARSACQDPESGKDYCRPGPPCVPVSVAVLCCRHVASVSCSHLRSCLLSVVGLRTDTRRSLWPSPKDLSLCRSSGDWKSG